MLHQQNPMALFELNRDRHERLLQEATQERLINRFKPTMPANPFLQWWRGQSQAPVIQEIPDKATPSVN